MSLYDGDPVEIEIIDTDDSSQPVESLEELMSSYNSTKKQASTKVESLAGNFTLSGMDSINDKISETMQTVNAFVNNGKVPSTVSKVSSRAISLIDPNNKWAGKWLNNAKENLDEEKLKEKSISKIVDELIGHIETKREEVLGFIEIAASVKQDMVESVSSYESLLVKAEAVLANAKDLSREHFDAQLLISQLTVTIEGIKSDIESQVNPLITGASISVKQIGAILPTIENELKYKTGFKAFQQQLADLNGMVQATTALASEAGDIIRVDINETIYESLEMIGETGLDTDRLKRIHSDEARHRQRLDTVMQKTKDKMDKKFVDVQQLKIQLDQSREDRTNLLIENYAK
jgi:hypothetical protein